MSNITQNQEEVENIINQLRCDVKNGVERLLELNRQHESGEFPLTDSMLGKVM